MSFSFIEGNEAIALGAIKSGCKFFAGYPITPATSILNSMMALLTNKEEICIQAEDEIASIGFCIGASMTGKKTMTATSGPGISLYSEQISFAIGSEIPLVIVDVQRLGPSTGSATLGADGDIQFLRWGNSGGLPIIVLSPTNVKDCYILTINAFNLAEKYRCPVIIASNKEIAVNKESINLKSIPTPQIINRKLFNKEETFLPFKTYDEKLVPNFLPIGCKDFLVRQTSSTHGIDGYITTSSDEINVFQKRLKNKINKSIDSFTYYELIEEKKSNILIICYGVTARTVKTVYKTYKKKLKPISVLILKTLWPLPKKIIIKAATQVEKIIIPEMNLGLYAREIKSILKSKKIISIGNMNGQLISPRQIEKELKNEKSS